MPLTSHELILLDQIKVTLKELEAAVAVNGDKWLDYRCADRVNLTRFTPPPRGRYLPQEDFDYLTKAEWDFVIQDDQGKPVLVIELDDDSHDEHRDELKNWIATANGIPLLRLWHSDLEETAGRSLAAQAIIECVACLNWCTTLVEHLPRRVQRFVLHPADVFGLLQLDQEGVLVQTYGPEDVPPILGFTLPPKYREILWVPYEWSSHHNPTGLTPHPQGGLIRLGGRMELEAMVYLAVPNEIRLDLLRRVTERPDISPTFGVVDCDVTSPAVGHLPYPAGLPDPWEVAEREAPQALRRMGDRNAYGLPRSSCWPVTRGPRSLAQDWIRWSATAEVLSPEHRRAREARLTLHFNADQMYRFARSLEARYVEVDAPATPARLEMVRDPIASWKEHIEPMLDGAVAEADGRQGPEVVAEPAPWPEWVEMLRAHLIVLGMDRNLALAATASGGQLVRKLDAIFTGEIGQ